ncbi:MAG: type II toxin-antitoxin system VapC family toxin [Anaerolineae bacterium]|nr:type II toxin-antitoxin system VapC family toxin [Anaerolineae bacterium]
MRYLLDSNTCIMHLTGRSASVSQQILAHPDEQIVTCAVVKAELFAGAMKSKYPERSLNIQRAFTDRFVSFPFDDAAAVVYGRIRSDLERNGTPIGPNDLLIASIAVSNELILVTHNTREFSRIPSLSIEDWE